MNKNTKLALIPFILLALVVTVSYAFFAINPSITEQELSVDAATISLEYTDCGTSNQSDCANISAELKPGDSVTKTFKVENTGDVEVGYAVVFKELTNTFLHDELVYTLVNITNNETLVEETPVSYADETLTNELILNEIELDAYETREYKLTIIFKEIEGSQNYNSNATFNIKLGIINNIADSLSNYKQVEYIQSSGNHWIDTGMIATPNTRVIMTFQFTSVWSQEGIFGSQRQNNLYYTCYVNWQNFVGTSYNDDINDSIERTTLMNTSTKFTIDFDGKNKTLKINKYNYSLTTNPTKVTADNLYLMAYNSSGNAGGLSYMKLYSAKIYENGTLVRDFIPAYRIIGEQAGLYDLVNNIFYPNAKPNGPNFVAGPIVNS